MKCETDERADSWEVLTHGASRVRRSAGAKSEPIQAKCVGDERAEPCGSAIGWSEPTNQKYGVPERAKPAEVQYQESEPINLKCVSQERAESIEVRHSRASRGYRSATPMSVFNQAEDTSV